MLISDVEKVLGRKEYVNLINLHKNINLKNKKILITGANGSIGTKLCEILNNNNINYLSTDIEGNHKYLDVTDFNSVFCWMNKYRPDFVINLAGLKYAPRGEHETWKTISINTIGTKNILDCAQSECRVILASTCKSCNPEIVYGASKLIAERMTLNAEGSVVRFYNVVETQGNVFEIWDNLEKNSPLEVVEECNRYFISINEAVGLILYSLVSPPGRFCVNLQNLRNMKDVANSLYPNKEKIKLQRRRGDRLNEKFMSTAEKIEKYELEDELCRIVSEHD
jgi:FlaA1/EpsC-like NDP-sugar epimerase